ncbi:EamA family transporter [Leifsonia sp. AG29]|uniref:EamA family transporter n=1 Tax=Leifsonia sp. AG29 TaxID=2598860 RepID=UPI00131C66A6|nr:EamA family transporter [Leifsonia sp. AG29]
MVGFFAAIDALFVALSSFSAGMAGRARPVTQVLVISSLASLTLVVTAAFACPGKMSQSGLLSGFIAGIVGGVGLILSYRGLAIGPVGAVTAGSQCTSTIMVTLAGAIVHHGISPLRIAALAASLAAIVLVCREPQTGAGSTPPSRRGAGPVYGVLAGFAFGFFIITIGLAPSGAGLWPVAAARFGVMLPIIALVAVVSFRRSARMRAEVPTPARRTSFTAAVLAGLTDGGANIFLTLALATGDLVLVALMGALAPAITALLGRLLLGERLTRMQFAGLSAAVLGGGAAIF